MTDALDKSDHDRRVKSERAWLAEQGPAPAFEDIARPFLQGLQLLHDLHERVDSMEKLADIDRDSPDAWDVQGRALLIAVRRAIDIVVRHAQGCVYPSHDCTERIAGAMRTVMETIVDLDGLAGVVEMDEVDRIIYEGSFPS